MPPKFYNALSCQTPGGWQAIDVADIACPEVDPFKSLSVKDCERTPPFTVPETDIATLMKKFRCADKAGIQLY
ncbi:hypothetical protein HDU86_003643 [Geranomyces michiganensis]|nr:hypothetical protein HDU86_003643 [Geranomyces michiganensis]